MSNQQSRRAFLQATAGVAVGSSLGPETAASGQESQTSLHDERLRQGVKRSFEVFDPLDFIAEITQHIPDARMQMIRYYGWYSNRSRGDRAKALAPAPPLTPPRRPSRSGPPSSPSKAAGPGSRASRQEGMGRWWGGNITTPRHLSEPEAAGPACPQQSFVGTTYRPESPRWLLRDGVGGG